MKIETKRGIVEYDKALVVESIEKAFQASGNVLIPDMVKELADKVTQKLKNLEKEIISKDEVEETIEDVLMSNKLFHVARAYIKYRYQRQLQNAIQTPAGLRQVFTKYINKDSWEINENANMSYSLQGLNNAIVRAVIEKQWLELYYPQKATTAYKEGYMHIHDLDSFSVYCVGWDIQDLLLQGFGGVPGKVYSAPPKHFDTALGQAVNFIFTLQNESSGAQAFSNFDTYLAPFIYYDKLTYKEVKQAMQNFVFNMNVPTRVGGQTPFSNITLDLVVPKHLADQPVIIGGQYQKETFKEFQKEMDMFNRAFFEVMIEGDAHGRIFTFPIPTINIDKNFDWDNPNLDILWEATAKYGLPYFANFINSDLSPEDARSMCPLEKNELIVYKSKGDYGVKISTIKDLYYNSYSGKEIQVLSGNKYVPARVNKFEGKKMVEITLANGHKLVTSNDHANLVMQNNKSKKSITLPTNELKPGMYLPYSLEVLPGDGGTYELGYFVGCYAGSGFCQGDSSLTFILNKNISSKILQKIRDFIISKNLWGSEVNVNDSGNSISLNIKSKAAVGLCRDYVGGIRQDKYYLPSVLNTSAEFRQGLIDGHFDTYGGDKIHTSSSKMVEMLNLIAASLGTTTFVENVTNKNIFSKTKYTVSLYQSNKKYSKDIVFKRENKLWIRIESIKDLDRIEDAYCLEVDTDDHLFTVGRVGTLTHNCRLRLSLKELHKRGGGLFGSGSLTGSIGVITLSLPMIAYDANGSIDKFFTGIEKYMIIAKEALEAKRKVLEELTEKGLYPYSKHYLKNVKLRDGRYWANHFSTIGIIGMYEAAQMLGIKYETEEGKKLAERVLAFMNKKLLEFQNETKNFYNLEATPAEGASYKLALAAKRRSSKIFTSGKDTPYFTNSTMLPVNFTNDIATVLEHQDKIQSSYTGGTVLHIYTGERLVAKQAKLLVKKIFEKYNLPYISITPTFSICPKHGYISGEHSVCPKCLEEKKALEEELRKLQEGDDK